MIGLIPYTVATLLAFVSPYVTAAICAAVALYYALPIASATEPVDPAPREDLSPSDSAGPGRPGR